jgi:hypothetical protein
MIYTQKKKRRMILLHGFNWFYIIHQNNDIILIVDLYLLASLGEQLLA